MLANRLNVAYQIVYFATIEHQLSNWKTWLNRSNICVIQEVG